MTQQLLSPSDVFRPVPIPERIAAVCRRWEEEGEPDALAALQERPEMMADKSFVLDLAYHECCLRYDRGEQIDIEAYCARFPMHRATMARMLAALQFIEEDPDRTADASAFRWPNQGEELGDLTILRELGRGAFARAYLTRESSTGDRLIVVKFARDGSHEARTLGPLRHPGIVPVLGAGHEPICNLHAVRMPFLGEATLEDLLERAFPGTGKPPENARIITETARTADPVEEGESDDLLAGCTYEEGIVRLLGRMAESLAFLHDRGVCHRDLKPTNVLLSPGGRPLLLDFNLSNGGAIVHDRLGGTLPYMAPEVLEAMTARSPVLPGPEADVFALGVIARELFTGRHPFGAVAPSKDVPAMVSMQLERQRAGCAALESIGRRVERRFVRLIDRCLSLDPAARPTAKEIAEESHRYFGPFRRRLRRVARRPFVSAAAALLLTATLAAAIGAAVAPPRRTSEESQAVLLFERGRKHLADRNTGTAYSCFQESDRLHSDGKALACMAFLEATGRSHGRANELHDEAVKKGFDGARVRNNRGYCRMQLADAARAGRDAVVADNWSVLAAEDFTEAIRLDPNLQAAYYNRAVLALRKQLADPSKPLPVRAVEDIRKAVGLGPITAALAYDAARIVSLSTIDAAKRRDEMLDHLEAAVKHGYDPRRLAKEPLFAAIKDVPRFQSLLEANPGTLVAAELRLLDPAPDEN